MEKKKKLTEKLLRRGFPLAEVKEELDKKEEYSEL
jgi:SOS response regulatory protein OraA/RecX